jgi:hypothetical protein
LWSAHPRSFGISGYLGNHISIGLNEKTKLIDIHETIYSSSKSNSGHILIADKRHHNYLIDKDNKTLMSTSHIQNNELAQILWDDICCMSNEQLTGNGYRNPSKSKTKLIRNNSKNVSNTYSITDIIHFITSKYVSLKCEKQKKSERIMRIPYVRRSRLLQLGKRLEKLKLDINMIISDSHTKTSLIVIGSNL